MTQLSVNAGRTNPAEPAQAIQPGAESAAPAAGAATPAPAGMPPSGAQLGSTRPFSSSFELPRAGAAQDNPNLGACPPGCACCSPPQPVEASWPAMGPEGAEPTAGAIAPPAAPTQSYQERFANQSYVKDPADPALVGLGQQLAQASPEMARAIGAAASGGNMGKAAVKAMQQELQSRGYDVGHTGADGKFGPNTYAAMARYMDDAAHGKLPAASQPAPQPQQPQAPQQQPSQPNSDQTYDVGGPQPAVKRQGKYIGQRIARQFDEMVAAARKDGVSLEINSGMRTRAEQQKLWDQFGHDTRRVARPGTSNHEKGNAIDFKNTPGAHEWLRRNAAKFGMHNYPPEPWHYSLDGR